MQIPEYLDLAVSDDNLKFVALTPDDINMYKVVQDSNCKHGKRRRMAARTLNALERVTV